MLSTTSRAGAPARTTSAATSSGSFVRAKHRTMTLRPDIGLWQPIRIESVRLTSGSSQIQVMPCHPTPDLHEVGIGHHHVQVLAGLDLPLRDLPVGGPP